MIMPPRLKIKKDESHYFCQSTQIFNEMSRISPVISSINRLTRVRPSAGPPQYLVISYATLSRYKPEQ